ncbi:hypothetical protein [Stenotrophomonas sp.]|uniref:hypothetical protein n=1 Tax=Stenotrophomonas sp. TaxID=69392 RepID=UPI0028AE9B2B|nr:hypothetical protein [Stenotrophomonas sp.]
MKGITIGGAVATAVYLAGVGWYVVENTGSFAGLKPNELGDFLAGSLGPLAFFWLICGYLQQGIELKQNTRALELQVQELQNSVDQQRELVAVTREQLQMEGEEVRRQHQAARLAALPVMVAKSGGSFNGDGNAYVRLNLTNVGGDVRNVLFSMPDIYQFTLPNVVLWSRGAANDLSWFIDSARELENFGFQMTYIDANGHRGQVDFQVRFEEPGAVSGVRFKTHVEVSNPD